MRSLSSRLLLSAGLAAALVLGLVAGAGNDSGERSRKGVAVASAGAPVSVSAVCPGPPARGAAGTRRVSRRLAARPGRQDRRRALPQLRGARRATRPGSAMRRPPTTRRPRRCRSILDGMRPAPGTSADASDHPRSHLHRPGRQGVPGRGLRGGHRAVPAPAVPRRPDAPAGDHSPAQRGDGRSASSGSYAGSRGARAPRCG